MLYEILLFIVKMINAVYYFIADTLGLRFMDMPGTYIIIMVIGFAFIPFFAKSIYYQYANPHEHYNMSLTRKTIMSISFIAAWLFFGYANLLRFM